MTQPAQERPAYVRLRDWLHEHEAQLIKADQNADYQLEWYTIKGLTVIVKHLHGGLGFDVYVPADDSNNIVRTLEALNIRLANYELAKQWRR